MQRRSRNPNWSFFFAVCLPVVLFIVAPFEALAQTGAVTYAHTIRMDLDLPEEMASFKEYMPPNVTMNYKMVFDGEQALTSFLETEVPDTPTFDVHSSDAITIVSELAGVAQALGKMNLATSSVASRSMGQDSESYVDYAEGTYLDRREFLDRDFLVSGALPEVAWKLTGEEAQFLDRRVMKATAVQDSTSIEAWFAPDIPVPLGPRHYGGLPGLILMLSLDEGKQLYEATEINLESGEVDVSPPEDGREVTEEEYRELVAKKMEEMQQGFRNFKVIYRN